MARSLIHPSSSYLRLRRLLILLTKIRPAPNRPQITHSPHFPLLELGGDLVWLEEAWLRGVDRHAKLARRRPYELDGVLVGSIGGG